MIHNYDQIYIGKGNKAKCQLQQYVAVHEKLKSIVKPVKTNYIKYEGGGHDQKCSDQHLHTWRHNVISKGKSETQSANEPTDISHGAVTDIRK